MSTDSNSISLHIKKCAQECAEAGMALARQGRLAKAEEKLRQAFVLLPDDASIAVGLARVMLSQGRAGDALKVIEQSIEAKLQADADALLVRAQILLQMQRYAGAIDAFKAAISAAPENGTAELGLAIALGECGHTRATEHAARRAIAKGADGAGTHNVLGRALFGCNRFNEAELEFRRALHLRPDDPATQCALAELVWMQTGNVALATRELDVALRKNSKLTELRAAKARLLVAAGNVSEAAAELELGLTKTPNDATLYCAAAQTALAVAPNQALAYAERAAQLAPGRPEIVAILGDALFAVGRIVDAERVATDCLRINPNDNHAIALLSSAWRVLKDPRRAEFSDYTNLVKATPLDTPAGWQSLSDYLRDLASTLHQMHHLQAHPVHQTLRFGSQIHHGTDPLGDPVILAFGQAIDGPIRRYMQEMGCGTDALRRRNTMKYKLNGLWSVLLKPQGHHLNHFHGKGWLSSACYIELPESLGSRNGEGWLKFGEPLYAVESDVGAEYFLKPEPGLLALFPSWMWHGTVPFTGQPQDRRLTMAFDVIPD